MVKHLKAKMILLLSFLAFGLTGFAQSGVVAGVVTDALDGSTLPGATVVVKGTVQGTVTNINGEYSISIEPNTTLVYSFVGYETQERLVQPGSTSNVALMMTSTALEEFVVIGYGVQKKEDATGAVTAIKADDFNKGAITSPAGLIAGKVAGVSISSNGGAPGTSSQIRIRGGSSLNASNDPLIVIDGIPITNNAGSGTRNPLNSLNPNDIETFTVLKDASATAIYGSRASNGVIIVTTKKGKEGAPLKIEYQGKFSINQVPKTLDIFSSSEFQKFYQEQFPNQMDMLGVWFDPDGNVIPNADVPDDREGYEQKIYSTDWQDEIYQNAFTQDHALSATGAWKMLPYRFSVGYTDQEGILKTSAFKRTTVGIALNPTLLDDHLKLNVNANGSFIKNNFSNQGAVGAAIQMDPTKPVLAPDGTYGGYYTWLENGQTIPNTQGTDNPVAMIMQNDDQSDANRIFGNFQADYKFHFLPELRANLNLALDHSKNEGTVYRPNYAAPWFNATQGGGENNEYTSSNKNNLLDFYLNYTKELDQIDSRLEVMGGYSWQQFEYENTFNNNNIPDTTIAGQILVNNSGVDKGELYLVSFFGRLNYTFKNRYLLTGTFRQDGTSRFSNNKWGLFPSVALGWKINEEDFLKDVQSVSTMKLRLGWGITGQQDIGSYYGSLARYVYGNDQAMYPFGNNYNLLLRPSGYNPNLKWETTTTWNIGLDYGFLEDRITGSVDLYQRTTDDLLSFVPEVAGGNVTNYIDKNIGSLENTGVEVSIVGRILSQQDMFWELGFNATFNKNEITELYQGASIPTGGIAGGVGNNIQVQAVGESATSFFVYEQIYDQDGNPIEGLYVDRNDDGQITPEDKYVYKKPAADMYFGISSNFTYKQWSFFFSGRANFGNYAYNNVLSENGWYNRAYRNEGPYASNLLSAVNDVNFYTAKYHSDYYVQDASFFRMDDITLSYVFDNVLADKLDLRLSATVNNAFTITNYTGLDPEVTGGIDNNPYPRSRVWTFGLNLIF